MRFRLFFALFALSFAAGDVAHASGPVERVVQVLLHPNDPNIVVVRWGVASEGFLFSRDGGKTFAAFCSEAITPQAADKDAGVDAITRLSSAQFNGNAATLLDATGHLQVTQLDGLWSDDATGCTWSRSIADVWPTSLALDPTTQELLAVVNVTTGSGQSIEARSLLIRRDASGSWTPQAEAGELVPHKTGQQAYGGELKVVKTATGTRLYASVQVSQGLTAQQSLLIVRSDDGGKTWVVPRTPVDPAQAETFTLIAVDPKEPKRVLGALKDDLAADTLLISEDEGATFSNYAELREASSVAFAPDGTVYVSDTGDATGVGGLWTATQLGMPLTKVANTATFDCAAWSSARNALYVCQGDKLRVFDPATTSFVGDPLIQLGKVDKLLSCPGADVAQLCQEQFNFGASWCCTGHYPCAPFCSMYDVTEHNGQRVFCGKSGLTYDLMVGRTCDMEGASSDGGVSSLSDAGTSAADAGSFDGGAGDAGQKDAGKATDAKPRKSDDGCAIGLHRPQHNRAGGALMSLGLLLMVLGRTLRRRGRRTARR
jgi:hypothetical protein